MPQFPRAPGALLPLLSCAALALALSACGKSASDRIAEAAVSAASGQDVEIDDDGGKVTLHGKDGDVEMQSGEDVELPKDFPDDVYLPEHYRVRSVMKLPQASMVQVTAKGSVGGLYKEADARMQAQGWEQTMAMQQSADTRMLVYKKDSRQAMLTINSGGGEPGEVQVGVQVSRTQQ